MTRAQDSADVVARRMAKAADEMSHYPEYDYVIINHDLAQSVAAVQTILDAERLRIERQQGLATLSNNCGIQWQLGLFLMLVIQAG